MSIGASIFLIAAGAIVRYALTFDIEGVDREALGLILMIAGAVGLAMSILYQMMWREDRRRQEQQYYEAQRPAGPDDRTRKLR
jgi:cytochrome c oxidase subunit IV